MDSLLAARPVDAARRSPSPDVKELLGSTCVDRPVDLDFVDRALTLLDSDRRRSVDTALRLVPLAGAPGVDLYFKDEAAHPTGSLKHRLARALLIFGIVNGTIRSNTPVVEASSGSTAVSEAYFAQLLGLPFHAVMPVATSPAKIAAIEMLGGICHLVQPNSIYGQALGIARQLGGCYLDQFTFAERVTDWRGDNLAAVLLAQMDGERHPVPDWIVVGAGTGGTATTIGRHLRFRRLPTRLCVADVEHSAFFDGFARRDLGAICATASGIEGVGRPRMEPSFTPDLIDRMVRVPDAVSIAGMRIAGELLGRAVGASTGLNFVASLLIARDMAAAGRTGSIATLICDGGERYATTCHCDGWLTERGLIEDVEAAEAELRSAVAHR